MIRESSRSAEVAFGEKLPPSRPYETILNNFKHIYLFLMVFVSANALAGGENGNGRNGTPPPSGPPPVSSPFSPDTQINKYIKDTLKKDPVRFNLTLDKERELKAGLILTGKMATGDTFDPKNPEVFNLLDTSGFSDSSLETLALIFRNLGHLNLNNTLLVGDPGVGKSHTVEQIVFLLSFGILPKKLQEKIGLELSKADNPYYKLFPSIKNAFVGRTQVVTVNSILLSFDNTAPGQAFAKATDRAKSIMLDLFEAAEKDFRTSNIRTVFIFEEMHSLEDHLLDTLKVLFDRTGFKTISDNPLVSGKDPGFSLIGLTTFKDRDKMYDNVKAQPIARRMHEVPIYEPPRSEVLKIAQAKAERLFFSHGIMLGDGVIEYLIHKARLLTNPPEAMPGSILKAMDALMGWASDSRNLESPLSATISISDVNKFFVTEVMKLPESIWLPSPTNPIPFSNLDQKIRAGFVDNPLVNAVPRIATHLKARINRGFDKIPFFILGGPTGSGKNTLITQASMEIFGHDSSELRIDVSGFDEEDIRRLFEGDPNSSALPEIFSLIQKRPSGIIILDEAGDTKPGALNYLKVLLDKRGRIQPRTPGARDYSLGYHAIVLAGQWGQVFFDKLKTDEEILNALKTGGPNLARSLVLAGRENGTGALDPAIVDRAVKEGDVIILPPVLRSSYLSIIDRQLDKILVPLFRDQKQIDLAFDEKFVRLIDLINSRIGNRTRELEGITEKIVDRALVAMNDGGPTTTPLTGSKVTFSANLETGKILVAVKNPGQKNWHRKTLSPKELLLQDCFVEVKKITSR